MQFNSTFEPFTEFLSHSSHAVEKMRDTKVYSTSKLGVVSEIIKT